MRTNMEIKYALGESGEFVIENYNTAKPFASFFPGIAGVHGIPMWAFYVNRGQCVCSMGIQDKDNAIMEFLSANRAYQLTSTQGFRTFVKTGESPDTVYEPFQNPHLIAGTDCKQKMIIKPHSLVLEEDNRTLGLHFCVEYYNVPSEDYAGLVRKLTITNLRDETQSIEVLDGLPLIIPFGVDNLNLKFMRRLVEAFVEVVNLENNVPYFRAKVKQEDRPEILRVKEGNFYLGMIEKDGQYETVNPVVDPQQIFGSCQDLRFPECFVSNSPYVVSKKQIQENILPCAMGVVSEKLGPGQSIVYTSVIGHADSLKQVSSIAGRVTSVAYLSEKKQENEQIVDEITQMNFVCSSDKRFDNYCRCNFLDNVLRGGLPVTLKGHKSQIPMYVYSRKHGDLERDYNEFCLLPSYYSQGNGNFRDVNQNRRSDLFINPDLHDHNVKHFFNLIQADGFNPLVVKPTTFHLYKTDEVRSTLAEALKADEVEMILDVLSGDFTPGDLMKVCLNAVQDKSQATCLVADVLALCEATEETDHMHGYWSDHWLYNLDLLMNYLAVYPEKTSDILFGKKEYTFHDSAYRVASRDEKYVLWDGNPMQLCSVLKDDAKQALIDSRSEASDRMHTEQGRGSVYKTTLFVKLLTMVMNKLGSLDAHGVGVEMESDKPNWYDALNGLPGQHGSSLNETLEVKRHLLFIQDMLIKYRKSDDAIQLPTEMQKFLSAIMDVFSAKYVNGEDLTDFEIWDRITAAKEQYRSQVFMGIDGKEESIDMQTINQFVELGLKRLDEAVQKAWNEDQNLPYSYFLNKVADYELIEGKTNARGQQCYRVKAFKQEPLPLFLEGPVHYLKAEQDVEKRKHVARQIKNSGLYDRKLKMYKVNESLVEQPMEIGRTRIFTPGWFENESIWLHMEYKYMLELLRNGLHNEFFADAKDVFVPFFDPAVYGRSILENSSFIASSANKNEDLHGAGFVARLSGATAEFIHILQLMTSGDNPYIVNENGELQLALQPVLPSWLFTEKERTCELYVNGQKSLERFAENTFSFMFMGNTLVTYVNPKRGNTYGDRKVSPIRIRCEDVEQGTIEINGPVLSGDTAVRVRDGKVRRIEVELG